MSDQIETHIADLIDPESGAVWLGAEVHLKCEVESARAADQAEIARLRQALADLADTRFATPAIMRAFAQKALSSSSSASQE